MTAREDGAIFGTFNILLHFPELGTSFWSVFKALADRSVIPAPIREMTILLTGARFSASYESYSHENVAFDLVQALLRGGPIPGSTYQLAAQHFGEEGMAEIACTIGCYTTIATLLNLFDVSVPTGELVDNKQEVGGR